MADLFKFWPQILLSVLLNVPIKCPKQFFYYEFICRTACEKKFKSKFHVFHWFPGLQNLHVFFGKFTVEQVLKSFLGRYNSLKPPFSGFSDSLPFGIEQWRELRALIRWVWGKLAFKNVTNSAEKSFLWFWAAIMDLLTALKY